MSEQLTEREVHVLRHALTGENTGCARAYRNYYYAGEGHRSIHEIRSLVEKGLMSVGRTDRDGTFYHCTEEGAAIVNLYLPGKRVEPIEETVAETADLDWRDED